MVPERLSHWGVDIPRDDDGRIAYAKWPFPFGTASIDPDMCHALASEAKRLGVRFLDRVALVELLTAGGLVSGAAGFSLDDGAFVAVRAGAVVLAMGSQNYDLTEMWCGTGNGIRAAYLAGAEMRNAEFGNMCDFARVGADGQLFYGVHGGAHTAHDHLHNAGGENISQKYRPGLHTSMDPVAAFAWYKETMAGNGPISADLSDFSGKDFFRFHPKALEQHGAALRKAGYPESQRVRGRPRVHRRALLRQGRPADGDHRARSVRGGQHRRQRQRPRRRGAHAALEDARHGHHQRGVHGLARRAGGGRARQGGQGSRRSGAGRRRRAGRRRGATVRPAPSGAAASRRER